jgi:L-aminopeptidase/D-esterase-like protein
VKAGPTNSICDVAGLTVGHAQDDALKSGVTALVCETSDNFAGVHVMGGAPGTRDTDLLAPQNTVQGVDAVVLAGGSAFGLDAAGGAQMALRDMGRGFAIGDQRVPIVPSAILFDLINGGNKSFKENPYGALGRRAVEAASTDVVLGSVGAGTGALTGGPRGGLKGGLGTASTVLSDGTTIIAALVAVNALGSPVIGESKHFWAAPFEQDNEFGGFGSGDIDPEEAQALRIKFSESRQSGANTTIGIIATDATLTKGAASRLAIAAHDGFARALWPAHMPLDGDLVFSVATCAQKANPAMDHMIELSAAASSVMARAIARGIFEATAAPNDLFSPWTTLRDN